MPEASCEACQKVTQKIEEHCQRLALGRARIALKFPTRKPNQRPTKIKATYRDGSSTREIEIDAGDLPVMVCLPRYGPPGIIVPDKKNELDGLWVYRDSEEAFKKIMPGDGELDIEASRCDPLIFARMIAKIAHGYLCATFGVDNFEHWLVPLILGQDEKMNSLVGSADSQRSAQTPSISIMLQSWRPVRCW